MCSIIGVGERLHNVLEQIDFDTLDSRERSLPFGLLVIYIVLMLAFKVQMTKIYLSVYS